MKFYSALSTADNINDALEDLQHQINRSWFGGEAADLACLFISAHHKDESVELLKGIHELGEIRNLIGCTGESIVGTNQEVEETPAISLWLAQMPDVEVHSFALTTAEISLAGDLDDWATRTGVEASDSPSFIILPEPFTSDFRNTLEGLNSTYPGIPILGGVPSAGGRGENVLFFNDQVHVEGLVGVALTGNVEVKAVVSQGCRPIGRPFVVTKAEKNLIFELAGGVALEKFQEVYETLDERDKAMVKKGLHVGRVIDEYKSDFRRGDFLIRNVLGADKESGGLAIADEVRVGQTIQFHVRDADSADEDLRELLELDIDESEGAGPAGALLFSCNGRGTRMFDGPCHDAGVVNEVAGNIPLAGFFAAGEIGPIGSESFIHGFTASLAMFRPKNG